MVSNPVLAAAGAAAARGAGGAIAVATDLDAIPGLPTLFQWQQIKADFGALQASVQVRVVLRGSRCRSCAQ